MWDAFLYTNKARGTDDDFPQLLTSLSMAKESYYQPGGRLYTTMLS